MQLMDYEGGGGNMIVLLALAKRTYLLY